MAELRECGVAGVFLERERRGCALQATSERDGRQQRVARLWKLKMRANVQVEVTREKNKASLGCGEEEEEEEVQTIRGDSVAWHDTTTVRL